MAKKKSVSKQKDTKALVGGDNVTAAGGHLNPMEECPECGQIPYLAELREKELKTRGEDPPVEYVLFTGCRLPVYSMWANLEALDGYVKWLDLECDCGNHIIEGTL